jgi:DNA-binding response OmpR family regulator
MTDNQKVVLLVEDEPLLANLLKQRLEKEGIKSILARDGEEGLRVLRETKPDLILLDIILPKISGFELMETLKVDPQLERAPIIIISNLGQESDVARGEALGAIQYFVKAKVSIEELIEHVKTFLKTSENKQS